MCSAIKRVFNEFLSRLRQSQLETRGVFFVVFFHMWLHVVTSGDGGAAFSSQEKKAKRSRTTLACVVLHERKARRANEGWNVSELRFTRVKLDVNNKKQQSVYTATSAGVSAHSSPSWMQLHPLCTVRQLLSISTCFIPSRSRCRRCALHNP